MKGLFLAAVVAAFFFPAHGRKAQIFLQVLHFPGAKGMGPFREILKIRCGEMSALCASSGELALNLFARAQTGARIFVPHRADGATCMPLSSMSDWASYIRGRRP